MASSGNSSLVRTMTRSGYRSGGGGPNGSKSRELESPASSAESVLASLVAMGLSYAMLFLAWRLSKGALRAWEDLTTKKGPSSAAFRLLAARNDGRSVSLTEHERALTACVVDPKNLGCALGDVGGLEEVVDEIRDLVVLPLSRPELFFGGGKLVRAPRGVLLYGPPGCGKTMLARAVAHDAGAALLDVRASTLSDKYYGETNKLVRAVFTLASKLAPCVVFMDEVDGFLAARSSRDADVTLALKAEFMSSLDGLLTDKACRGVVVLAATNRPFALDAAVLRRFARQFKISLPDYRARKRILFLLLTHYHLDPDVDLDAVAKLTDCYSGADLEEVCRAAATRPVRELARAMAKKLSPLANNEQQPKPRNISVDDFRDALRRVAPTGADAHAYRLDKANMVAEVD